MCHKELYSASENPICRSLINFFKNIDFFEKDGRTDIDEIMAEFANNGRNCDEDSESNEEVSAQSTETELNHYFRPRTAATQYLNRSSTSYEYPSSDLLIDPAKLRILLPFGMHGRRTVRNRPSSESSRSMRNKSPEKFRECVFCKNNKEPIELVRSHLVRDSSGKVICPILRQFRCPICDASGDHAHTVKYCPKKPIITMEDTELAERFGITKQIINFAYGRVSYSLKTLEV